MITEQTIATLFAQVLILEDRAAKVAPIALKILAELPLII
jgi:hypothetical protein